ncbi:MAG: ABC transporter permease [Lachnospiraceae bacterium]
MHKTADFVRKNVFKILLILPAIYIFIFMFYPVLTILVKAFYNQDGLTMEYFARFFQTPLYGTVLKNTFVLSLTISIASLLLAYPVAYTMVKSGPKTRIVINIILQITFWSSLLVRTYAWIIMLQKQGVINSVLQATGLIEEPLQLLHTHLGVICGMTYLMIPYMVFSLTAVMEQINPNLLTASSNLGASSVRTFFSIFLPLSMPGVIAGFTIVFLNSLGYYIVPALLGSEKNTMMSQLIQTQISKVLDWNFAAAISIVLIVVTVLVMMLSQRFGRVRGTRGGLS